MAKCIKHTSGKIKRVSDEVAGIKVKSGEYTYCSKSDWKKAEQSKEGNKT